MSNYSKLNLIKPDHSIIIQHKVNKQQQIIITEVSKLLQYFSGVHDSKLVRFIATMIENLIKKKYECDKKQIFINVVKTLFPEVSDNELNISLNILEDLLSSNQIKKIPVLRYAVHLAKELIFD